MDKKLVVTKEHLPQRCEICHQADMFIPQTAHCKRCSKPVVNPEKKAPKNIFKSLLTVLLGIFVIPYVILFYGMLFWKLLVEPFWGFMKLHPVIAIFVLFVLVVFYLIPSKVEKPEERKKQVYDLSKRNSK